MQFIQSPISTYIYMYRMGGGNYMFNSNNMFICMDSSICWPAGRSNVYLIKVIATLKHSFSKNRPNKQCLEQ